ncbi:MAG: VOC family protein [Christensenellales bacterium]|jgi:lactoylglutathione lyase
MGKVTGLAHIGVRVRDVEASKQFYMGLLGFELEEENDLGHVQLAFLKNGNCLIELISADVVPEMPGQIDHICMEVEGIDALVADLREKGLAFEGDVAYAAAIRGGVKNIFFRGPDGERIEFFDYLR